MKTKTTKEKLLLLIPETYILNHSYLFKEPNEIRNLTYDIAKSLQGYFRITRKGSPQILVIVKELVYCIAPLKSKNGGFYWRLFWPYGRVELDTQSLGFDSARDLKLYLESL